MGLNTTHFLRVNHDRNDIDDEEEEAQEEIEAEQHDKGSGSRLEEVG